MVAHDARCALAVHVSGPHLDLFIRQVSLKHPVILDFSALSVLSFFSLILVAPVFRNFQSCTSYDIDAVCISTGQVLSEQGGPVQRFLVAELTAKPDYWCPQSM